MAVNTIKVRLIGQNKEYYQIEFPELTIPVNVSEEIFEKMLHSKDYEFAESEKIRDIEMQNRKSVA